MAQQPFNSLVEDDSDNESVRGLDELNHCLITNTHLYPDNTAIIAAQSQHFEFVFDDNAHYPEASIFTPPPPSVPAALPITAQFTHFGETENLYESYPMKHVGAYIYATDDSIEDDISSTTSESKYTCISDTVHSQQGDTCYAHATATVLRRAESRIISRKLKSHEDEVNALVSRYGVDGADEQAVLSEECGRRNLKYEQVNVDQATNAVSNGRTILAAFDLDDSQWDRFSAFFEAKPHKVLTKEVIGDADSEDVEGHSIAICGTTKKYWVMKNSWGKEWADGGYCRIAKDAIPDLLLYDIQSNLAVKDWGNSHFYNAKRCDAKSIAEVVRAAELRIIEREPKSVEVMGEEILIKMKQESVPMILERMCAERGLRFDEVALDDVGSELSINRPMILAVELSERNWYKFIRICRGDENIAILADDEWQNEKKETHFIVINKMVIDEYGSVYRVENPWFDGIKWMAFEDIAVHLYDIFFFQHELTRNDWIKYIIKTYL